MRGFHLMMKSTFCSVQKIRFSKASCPLSRRISRGRAVKVRARGTTRSST